MVRPGRIVVAIPIKNEEALIGACLRALLVQADDFDHVLLLLNNCTDGSLEICQQFANISGKFIIERRELSGDQSSAGEARRLAFEQAMEMAGEGVVLTTDADAVPAETWVAANLRSIGRGADVVCGMAKLHPMDVAHIPRALRVDEKDEACLMAVQDEIAAMIDPSAADPWPRHQQHSGASMAMLASILRLAGGAPHVAAGEDRALVERLLLVDARVRHAPEISVRVSGRLDGRADGGMAATLKRRLQQRDALTDERLEPTVDAYRRVLARLRLREVIRGVEAPERLAEDLLVSTAKMRHALHAPYFGATWAEIQQASVVLQRRRVAFSGLRREIRQALELRDQLSMKLLEPRSALTVRDSEGNFSSEEDVG